MVGSRQKLYQLYKICPISFSILLVRRTVTNYWQQKSTRSKQLMRHEPKECLAATHSIEFYPRPTLTNRTAAILQDLGMTLKKSYMQTALTGEACRSVRENLILHSYRCNPVISEHHIHLAFLTQARLQSKCTAPHCLRFSCEAVSSHAHIYTQIYTSTHTSIYLHTSRARAP